MCKYCNKADIKYMISIVFDYDTDNYNTWGIYINFYNNKDYLQVKMFV